MAHGRLGRCVLKDHVRFSQQDCSPVGPCVETMRRLVLLSLFQILFGLPVQKSEALVPGPVAPGLGKSREEDGLLLSLYPKSLVIKPGDTFDVTVVVKSGLSELLAQKKVWLGLRVEPAGGTHGVGESVAHHGLLWKVVRDDKASWSVTLNEEGDFSVVVLAGTPCEGNNKELHNSPCFLPLPSRQESQVHPKVTHLYARLVVSWDQPQTVEALSDLADLPQGVLKVSALALDSSEIVRNVGSIVQLVAVSANEEENPPLHNVLGGTTSAMIESGVAAFPKLRFLQPGTYKLVALADGAQAAETAPLIVTPSASRYLRFCEPPPAVIIFPRPAPIRLAVECVMVNGERDTSFEGQVELQLRNDHLKQELVQQSYKVQCLLGLCLWNRLTLAGPLGQYRLKAKVVQTAAGEDSASTVRPTRPAVSSLVEFRTVERVAFPITSSEYPPYEDVDADAEELLRFLRPVPNVVRLGQPLNFEVAVVSTPLSVPEAVLQQESTKFETSTGGFLPAKSRWSSWMIYSRAGTIRRRISDRQRLWRHRPASEGQTDMRGRHKIQISLGASSPDNAFVLSGNLVGTTNEKDVAIFSGLTVWKTSNAVGARQRPWITLRVACMTCGVNKRQAQPVLESSKTYIDASVVVGAYSNPSAAMRALSRWHSAKLLANQTESVPVTLPGHPAQVCVQLLERPFVDVLITAHSGEELSLIGFKSIRVSPYTWPQPACWKFLSASELPKKKAIGEYQNVRFRLRSNDAAYDSNTGLSWKGLAASDGIVPIIVLPSRAFPRSSRLLHSLRKTSFPQLELVQEYNADKPTWINLREGPLRGRARILLLPPQSAHDDDHEEPVVLPLQLQGPQEGATLQWKSTAVMHEIHSAKTLAVLELMVIGHTSSIHIKGTCTNKDAGAVLVATIEKHILSLNGKSASLQQDAELGQQNGQREQVEVFIDWDQLSPESAGLLQHHIICEFAATSGDSTQPLTLVPKASVDIIATRRQCEEGYIFSFHAAKCLPCPEGFECLLATATPCKPGETSAEGMLRCQPPPTYAQMVNIRTVPDLKGCPPGLHQQLGLDGSSQCVVCPAGFSCQNKKMERCPPGTYAPVGSGICSSCPKDAVCPDPSILPEACPFGWQRSSDENGCTPCRAGTMCKWWSEPVSREAGEVACPLGTYTKIEYPGICIPCPPGFQCSSPTEAPQPCPPGTSSLGGARVCAQAPKGLIVVQGKEHLPARPCEDDLIPLEINGTWVCGIDYEDKDGVRERTLRNIQASPAVSALSRADPFPSLCEADFMDHRACFGAYIPPQKWCPSYHLKPQEFPTALRDSPFRPIGGGFSQYFTSCGYLKREKRDYSYVRSQQYYLHLFAPHLLLRFRLSVCGPKVWRDIKPGYFQLSWKGGVTERISDKFETPREYLCWQGHRCEGKHHWPWPCLPGTFANAGATACTKCPAGWPCPMARTSQAQLVMPCWPGHYCPEGSASPTAQPCPPGTVNHNTAAEDETACKPCPPGWICSERAFQAVGFEACPPGHYCAERSAKGTPCPAGTYSPYPAASERMKSVEDCLACVAGYYCPQGTSLLQMLNLPCPAGRVCPAGTGEENVPKCPPGFYSSIEGLAHEQECLPCPAGFYCDYGDADGAPTKITGECPDLLMSLNTGKSGDGHSLRPIEPEAGMAAQCVTCDAGYKCAKGLRSPCGRGYYSDGGGVCLACKAGHYCTDEVTTREQMQQQRCPAGTFCPEGVDSVPLLASHPCPQGHYCPEGSEEPVECKVGTINPKAGQADPSACILVPAGQYASIAGLAQPEGPCDKGFYCPEGSTSAQMHPCPAGTHGNQPGARNEEDCDKCPQGYYCDGHGEPQYCTAGHYCAIGSVQPQKCPAGTLSPAEGNISSSDCLACPPGYYCATEGIYCMAAYSRFMCYGGAVSPEPDDGETGEVCSAGGYCAAGATTKSYCPPGTYNPDTGGSSKSDCKACLPGYFCTGSHSTEPDGPCAPGAYCTGGAESSRQAPEVAQEGHYAPAGSSVEFPCTAGSFAPHEGLAECYLCPPGWKAADEGATQCQPCDLGMYCPKPGTSVGSPCPIGTYRSAYFASSLASCHQCPPYKACTQKGLGKQVFEDCKAGYYCIYGSTSTQPETDAEAFDISKAGPCPPGFYCEQGKPPMPCPRGTLGLGVKLTKKDDCTACAEGTECNALGGVSGSPCPEKFFCPSRTANARQKANLCPKGRACPTGSAEGQKCAIGKFAPLVGASECLLCPAGFFCEDPAVDFEKQPCPHGHVCVTAATQATPCPAGTAGRSTHLSNESLCLACPPGYYCGSAAGATDNNIQPCPEGTYSNPGTEDRDQCLDCPEGYFCPEATSTPIPCLAGKLCSGATLLEPNGDCPEGYYCNPPDQIDSKGAQECILGAYCPEGTSGPLLCPIGTTSSTPMAKDMASCTECPSGRYCGTPGLTAPEGPCSPGYFCPEGTFVSKPQVYLCPSGHKCPAGSTSAVPCEESMHEYQPDMGQASCKECPAGFLCTQEDAEPCPEGKFCPVGAAAQSCSEGTFNPLSGMQSATACIPCLPGWACTRKGLGAPDAECSAGYYCVSAAPTSTPEQEWSDGGGFCTAGFICPKRSISQRPCPSGSYCSKEKADVPTGSCDAGHFCAHHATDSQPPDQAYFDQCPSDTTQGICPSGTFCPAGSVFPLKCPAGTIRRLPAGKSLEECVACPEGSFCALQGSDEVTSDQCVSGRHCVEGSRTRFGVPCPRGHYCTAEAPAPQKCPVGTYQPSTSSAKCEPCPDGFVCNEKGAFSPESCPKGHFCSDGVKTACPAGTYLDVEGASNQTACKPCPKGMACETDALMGLQAATYCQEGYYCRLGAPSPTPTAKWCADNTQTACYPGARCPVGYFCPGGSAAPQSCPAGTTGTKEGAAREQDCLPCPHGFFCPSSGGQWPCHAGFVCLEGAFSPRPSDATGRMCQEGHRCEDGRTETPCAAGTFADVKARSADEVCPVGKVCPEGSWEPEKCPKGSFNKVEGMQRTSQCTLCSPGKYCDQDGLEVPSGPCKAGYYCQAGSIEASSEEENWPKGSGKCPPGHYCPEGSPANWMSFSSTAKGQRTVTTCSGRPKKMPSRNVQSNLGKSGSFTVPTLLPRKILREDSTVEEDPPLPRQFRRRQAIFVPKVTFVKKPVEAFDVKTLNHSIVDVSGQQQLTCL
ncbi:hypothetical protein Efla_000152 [Eimeria flavescens]